MPQFRNILSANERGLVVLVGAGVSMVPPTLLPSGDRLRDMCIEQLLADDTSRSIVRRLLRAPGYTGLLPEAVLQMIGSSVGSILDIFMKKALSLSKPNLVHRTLAKATHPVFTTNFDLCLEMAGNEQVCHLHGTIKSPDRLQNQIYRLGKTSRIEAERFANLTRKKTLVVLGYSFRDDDIVDLIIRSPPKQLLYLAFDGRIPHALRAIPSNVIVSKGSVQTLLKVTAPSFTQSGALRPFPRTRLPAIAQRANALIRICSRAGLFDVQLKLLNAYFPKLHGRQRLLAMCEVADSLRLAERYEEAEALANDVLRDRFARSAQCRDVLSTALVQCGLIGLDRGETDLARIEFLFRQGLQVFEELIASEASNKHDAENDIWRARILNNIGLVLAARSRFHMSIEMFELSLQLKARHHDRYGIAQTRSNIARVQILAGNAKAAVKSLELLITQLTQTPEAYICADAIGGCLKALRDTNCLAVVVRNPTSAASRSKRWWQKLLQQSHSSSGSVRRVLANLRKLKNVGIPSARTN